MLVPNRFINAKLRSRLTYVAQNRCTISDRLRIAPRSKAIPKRVHIRVGPHAWIAKQIPRATAHIAPFEDDETLLRTLHPEMTRRPNPRQPRAHDDDVKVLHA